MVTVACPKPHRVGAVGKSLTRFNTRKHAVAVDLFARSRLKSNGHRAADAHFFKSSRCTAAETAASGTRRPKTRSRMQGRMADTTERPRIRLAGTVRLASPEVEKALDHRVSGLGGAK